MREVPNLGGNEVARFSDRLAFIASLDIVDRYTNRLDDFPLLDLLTLRESWRLAEAGFFPMTKEIQCARFDQPIDEFLMSLETTLPTIGSSPVANSSEKIRFIHDTLAASERFDRYHVNLITELFARIFAYALPSANALERIAAISKGGVAEMGAGKGYWAALMSNLGCNVVAYDIKQVEENDWVHDTSLEQFIPKKYLDEFPLAWYPITVGTPKSLQRCAAETLLLIWPHKADMVASKSVRYFNGRNVVYIGEPRGLGCAEDEFYEEMWSDRWKLKEVVRIPRFPWFHDAMFIYERR